MPSSQYNCVKKSDVAKLKKTAAQFKRMSDPKLVRRSASRAGGSLRDNMQKLVEGESSLKQHQNVGAAFRVYSNQDNVNVGLPQGHPLLDQAQQMHDTYQVSDVAFDLAQQSGEVESQFHSELGLGSETRWRRMTRMFR